MSVCGVEDFIDHIYQARAITQERTAAISNTTQDEYGITRKSKMAYFFAVLEDHLRLAEPRAPQRGVDPPAAGV